METRLFSKGVLLATLIMFSALSGLITTPILAEQDLEQGVRSSGLVNESQPIVLSSNVYFYPDKKGFSMFSSGRDRVKAYLIFTDSALMVVDRSRKNERYETSYTLSFDDIDAVEVDGNAPFIRLVTRQKSSGRYDSFELMDGRNALSPNVQKTRDAEKIVQAGMQGLDVTQVMTAAGSGSVELIKQQQQMQELEARIQRLEQTQGKPAAAAAEECDCTCPQQE